MRVGLVGVGRIGAAHADDPVAGSADPTRPTRPTRPGRPDPADPATGSALESCAKATTAPASHGLKALVEPLPVSRVDGHTRLDGRPEALIRAVRISRAPGATSARSALHSGRSRCAGGVREGPAAPPSLSVDAGLSASI